MAAASERATETHAYSCTQAPAPPSLVSLVVVLTSSSHPPHTKRPSPWGLITLPLQPRRASSDEPLGSSAATHGSSSSTARLRGPFPPVPLVVSLPYSMRTWLPRSKGALCPRLSLGTASSGDGDRVVECRVTSPIAPEACKMDTARVCCRGAACPEPSLGQCRWPSVRRMHVHKL